LSAFSRATSSAPAEVSVATARARQVLQEAHGDVAAPGADVRDQHALPGLPPESGLRPGVLEHVLHDRLRRRPRDEHPPVHLERQPEEPPLADEILHRLVHQRASDKVAQLPALQIARRAVRIQEQPHVVAPDHVRHQQPRLQLRRVEAFLLESLGHPRQEAARGPGFVLGGQGPQV
jgi:hypothetical protein